MKNESSKIEPIVIDVNDFTRKLNEAIEESAVSLTIFKTPGDKRFYVGRSQYGIVKGITRSSGCNYILDLEIILRAIGNIFFETLLEMHCQIDAVEFAKDYSEKIRDEMIRVGVRTMRLWSEAGEMERVLGLGQKEGR